jgi:hypothetical protein
MNNAPLSPPALRHEITTLVDHEREGRFVVAFCPICDHAEESEDGGGGREHAQYASVAKIEVHIRKRHRAKADGLRRPAIRRA